MFIQKDNHQVLHDGLGNVTGLMDRNKEIITWYDYSAFRSFFVYFRMRYYRPELGRFVYKDPLGMIDGMNMFVYVQNNPENWVDPFGLENCNPFPPPVNWPPEPPFADNDFDPCRGYAADRSYNDCVADCCLWYGVIGGNPFLRGSSQGLAVYGLANGSKGAAALSVGIAFWEFVNGGWESYCENLCDDASRNCI